MNDSYLVGVSSKNAFSIALKNSPVLQSRLLQSDFNFENLKCKGVETCNMSFDPHYLS